MEGFFGHFLFHFCHDDYLLDLCCIIAWTYMCRPYILSPYELHYVQVTVNSLSAEVSSSIRFANKFNI